MADLQTMAGSPKKWPIPWNRQEESATSKSLSKRYFVVNLFFLICLDMFQCDDNTCPPSHGSCKNITNEAGLKFQHCKCEEGYQGRNCDDINECSNVYFCKNDGGCVNLNGTFSCNCTGTGFEGARCESPIDNCNPNPCENQNQGECKNVMGGGYHCYAPGYESVCQKGFGGPDFENDKNECSQNNNPNNCLGIFFVINQLFCLMSFVVLIC